MSGMVLWQRAEGALIFLGCMIFLYFGGLPFAWWIAVLIFFSPDLSFVGYALGPRMGAVIYNVVHIYALGAILLLIGVITDNALMQSVGALLFGHVGFDRMFGYGLKSMEAFTITHMGKIGKDAN